MNDALTISGLTKTYKDFKLNGVSFSVPCGSIVGLIGENGAGKSTTINLILNELKRDSGSIEILGTNTFDSSIKQEIGVVFGGIDFYPLKKLSTITAVTRRFYKDWDQDRYTEYLRQFSLDENKQFRTLSNGMKVKYLLALALSHHAKLYLLDEPTSGLDPVSRDEILHLFTRIVKDGKRSILFSTHITSDLDRCADDITYIQNGKVLLSADKDTFLRSFDHLKTPEDNKSLTLEEIMLRTEGRNSDETAL